MCVVYTLLLNTSIYVIRNYETNQILFAHMHWLLMQLLKGRSWKSMKMM